MIYWSLFLQFLIVSIIAIGGGQASLPIIERKTVGQMHWISPHLFGISVAFSYVTPGPLSILATFIGYQVAGFLGALSATIGVFIAPWLIIIFTASQVDKVRNNKQLKRFMDGAKLAVIGLLGVTLLSLGKSTFENHYLYIVLSVLSAFIVLKWKTNPIYILLVCGAIGLLVGLINNIPL